MEIALISFDGLDPRVLYRNQNKLPNFSEFMSDSVHGVWNTPGHTIPSFVGTLTGRQYNVVNFHWDEGRGEYQRHRQTEYDFLWDVCDRSMSLLNIPVLYPPEPIDDAMVCGFLTPDGVHDSNLARPSEVQDYLNSVNYVPDVHAGRTYEELGGDGMFQELCTIMDDRVDVAEWLIDRYDSDLFYGVWSSTDRWFHQCTMHGEDHMRMYEKADETFGEILELLPEDVPVIAFSDHGFAHYGGDEGVHKGHMYDGWYSINHESVGSYRDDSANILDLFPTVVNYLGCGVPDGLKGRTLLHRTDQNKQVEQRLRGLGYME